MCSTCLGHKYIHHQELATILLNYHIGRIVLGSMCVSVWLRWSGIRVAGWSKLLMMDILKSETCWANKKWNKIASDIKLELVEVWPIASVELVEVWQMPQWKGELTHILTWQQVLWPEQLNGDRATCMCCVRADDDYRERHYKKKLNSVALVRERTIRIITLASFNLIFPVKAGGGSTQLFANSRSVPNSLLSHSIIIFTSDTELTNYGNLNLKYYNSKYINEVGNQGTTTTISNHYCV